MTTAAESWSLALASWAIPQDILDAAPESPWGHPVELFANRADAALKRLTPSDELALEVLPEGGTVLDIGCGAGASSLALASRAGLIIGVDASAGMLEAFRRRAADAGVQLQTMEGPWPESADRTPVADVVVCHHVAYNAPDLGEFAQRLTDHARRRVVMELTTGHPLSNLNDLWMRFHSLARPTVPTADDAVAVLREAGLEPSRLDWTPPASMGFRRKEDVVLFVRRRLCLGGERDPEIAEAISGSLEDQDGTFWFPPRPVVTLWWGGSAQDALRLT
jgi:SAM-dependent methyltransferase